MRILALDRAGHPSRWINAEQAIKYYAKGMVLWAIGDTVLTYHGGVSRLTGLRSTISASSIIAIDGDDFMVRHFQAPQVTSDSLFARDRHMCAYCGGVFSYSVLTRDHIRPRAQGGQDTWMNLVTACQGCNRRKGSQTPDQARMPLLYIPYVPCRYEHFILVNRRILSDQMEFLLTHVPAGSRLHAALVF